ncbi:MAG: hypothetical protein ACLFTK_17270 [Anaerolineales bacterium]
MDKRRTNEYQPMYGWALKPDGTPVPIAEAERNADYLCPISNTKMIAKKGQVRQHHFAHAQLMEATPENVARAVAGLWLLQALRAKLAAQEPVRIAWQLKDQDTAYTVNILQDVVDIQKQELTPGGAGDLLLHDATGKTKVIIMLGLDGPPNPDQLRDWVSSGTTVIMLNPVEVRNGQMHMDNLLAASTIMGGWWLLDEAEMPGDLVSDPEAFRATLRETVSTPPHYFYSALTAEGPLSYVLTIGQKKLWLPPEIWQEVIGGTRNRLGPNVTVIIQEWRDTDDGSVIELIYITASKTAAVVVKRYAPGQDMTLRLPNTAFRQGRITALDLARQISENRG